MSEVEVPVPAAPASTKKVKQSASKKPKNKPTHPKTADMVDQAIKNLKERGGSSLQAIKKYISANYKVDAEKLSPFLKKYLKTSVANGKLVQTKGKGASGSFKLASKEKVEKGEKKVKSAGTKKPRSPKKTAVTKKAAAPKKQAAEKPKAPKKVASSKKPKSSSKAKKATKAPAAKKPKAPKPKKAAAKPKAAKKATPKKK